MKMSAGIWGYQDRENLAPRKPARTFAHRSPVKCDASPYRLQEPGTESRPNDTPTKVEYCSTKMSGMTERTKLIEQFQANISSRCETAAFCGKTGLAAMVEMIRKKNNVDHKLAEEKALRVLDHWLLEKIIRHCSGGKPNSEWFLPDNTALYVVNPPEEHRVFKMTPRVERRSGSKERRSGSVSRRPSFEFTRRIFGLSNEKSEPPTAKLLFEPRDAMDDLVGRDAKAHKVAISSENEMEDPSRSECHILADDVLLFESALALLLMKVDVQFVDSLQALKDKEGGVEGFLSKMMKMMVVNTSEKRIPYALDSIKSNRYVRSSPGLMAWFEAGSKCAPALVFKEDTSKTASSNVSIWSKQLLQEIANNCSAWTHDGRHPLLPAEFDPVFLFVSQNMGGWQKLDERHLALRLLWHLIPNQCRRRMHLIISFLASCEGIDYQKISVDYETCWAALKPFIFDKLADSHKDIIMKTLISLHKADLLTKIPDVLQDEIERQQRGEENVPVMFGHEVCETRKEADQHLIDLVNDIQTTSKFSAREKMKKLAAMKETHPHIMQTYFPLL